jgi:hypothetical protein
MEYLAPRAVRVLPLDARGAPPEGLLSVEVGTRLVFSMRPSERAAASAAAVWTNCPLLPGEPFRRHVFSCLEGSDEGPLNLNGDWQTYVDIARPGCFEFFVEFVERGQPPAAPQPLPLLQPPLPAAAGASLAHAARASHDESVSGTVRASK